jgi:hypothetical protein
MSRARLVITAVVLEGRGVREVARDYGVSPGWVSKLVARYRAEGEAAFEPRSRRPKRSPKATPGDVVALIVDLRRRLTAAGDDAGADTIRWHLDHDFGRGGLGGDGLALPAPGRTRRRPAAQAAPLVVCALPG